VVGHSSGAHLAVSILADLIRQGRVPANGPALSFLSLGQVVPMVSFLPKADRLRADLHYLSARDELTWVDVTAPGDGCAFALCDPVAVSGVAPADQRWPLVISAAFTQTLTPETLEAAALALLPAAFPVSLRLRPAGRLRLFPHHRGAADAGRALRRAAAFEEPDRRAASATPRWPHDPAEARGAARPGLALALHAAFPAGHPVGPARAALPRLDGRVPHAVLPELPGEPARAGATGAAGAADGFPEIRPGGRGAAPASGQVGVPDQWRDLAAPAPDHRPGLRGRAAARHLPGDAGGGARRRWRGLRAGRGWSRSRRDEPCRGGRDLSHALFDPDRGADRARRCSGSSAPTSAPSRS
jgi:hypothetical protein